MLLQLFPVEAIVCAKNNSRRRVRKTKHMHTDSSTRISC